jgi:hypothetical protein
MNDQTNRQADVVAAPKELPEFLKRTADKLEADGEVLVQTDEETGANAQPVNPTVH